MGSCALANATFERRLEKNFSVICFTSACNLNPLSSTTKTFALVHRCEGLFSLYFFYLIKEKTNNKANSRWFLSWSLTMVINNIPFFYLMTRGCLIVYNTCGITCFTLCCRPLIFVDILFHNGLTMIHGCGINMDISNHIVIHCKYYQGSVGYLSLSALNILKAKEQL